MPRFMVYRDLCDLERLFFWKINTLQINKL